MIEILHYSDSNFEEHWTRLLNNCDFCTPYYSSIAQNYFLQRPKDEGKILEEKSIIFLSENTPLMGFRGATVESNGNKDLLAYEMPSVSIENKSKITNNVAKTFLREFDRVTKEVNGNIFFRDFILDGQLLYLSKHLLYMGALVKPVYSQIIDLSSEKATKKASIRKSYGSLINWGIRELHPNVYDATTITWEHMEAFRQIHIKEAGRKTRSKMSWKRQYEMVQAGEAFVVLGNLENEIVSAGFFMTNKTNCYYLSSASRRDLFEKPLFHALMWTAILYAKKHGCRWFEVGEQLFPNHLEGQLPTKKELGISDFKAGFGGRTRIFLDLKLDCSKEK